MKFFHKLTNVTFKSYLLLITIFLFVLGYIGTTSINKSTIQKIEKIKYRFEKQNKIELIKQTNIISNILENNFKNYYENISKRIIKEENLLKNYGITKIHKKLKDSAPYFKLENAIILNKDLTVIKSYYPLKESDFKNYLKKKDITIKDLEKTDFYIINKNPHIIRISKNKQQYYYIEYYSNISIIERLKNIFNIVLKENISMNNTIFISDKRKNTEINAIIPLFIPSEYNDKIYNILNSSSLDSLKNNSLNTYRISDGIKFFIYLKSLNSPPIKLYSCYVQNIAQIKNEINDIKFTQKRIIFEFHLLLTLALLIFIYFILYSLNRFKKTNQVFNKFFKKTKDLNTLIDIDKIHYEEFRELTKLINTKIKLIQKIQNDLRERDNFLKSLEKGLETLFSIEDNEKAIKKFLQILSENLGLSFIMVVIPTLEKEYKLRYMWGNKEKDLKRLFNKIPKKLIDILVNEFTQKGKKYLDYHRNKTTKPIFPKSVIFFPIFIENKFWGIFVAGKNDVENQWSDVMKITLSSFVKTLALYIVKSERERDIKENEHFLKLLLENLKSAVYLIDENGYFAFANKAIEKLTGYTFEELKTKKFYDIVSDTHKNMVKERGEDRLKNKNPVSDYEFKIVTKEGKEKWIEIANDYIELLGKKYILGTAYDISEKYQTLLLEKTLTNITNATLTTDNVQDYILKIKDYLSEIIDISNFSFLLHKKQTLDIQIITYEDKYDDFGKTTKLGKNSLTEYIIRNQKALLLHKKEILQMAKEGKIKIIGTLPEVWMGIPFNLDEEYNAAIVMQNYEDRNTYTEKELELMKIVIHHIALAINRIKFLNKIKESEEKYRTLFENAHDTIYLLDQDILVNCNDMATKLLKTDKKNIIGKSLLDFAPHYQDEREKIPSDEYAKEKIESILKGKPQIFEWKVKDSTGNILVCEVSLNKIEINDKHYLMAIMRDITERKKMIADLKKHLSIMKFQNEEIFHRVMNNLQLFKSIFNLYLMRGDYQENTKAILKFFKEKTQLISNILTEIYIHPLNGYLDLSKSFNKLVSDWLSLHKYIKMEKYSYEEIHSKIRYILGSLVALEQLLNLIANKFKTQKTTYPKVKIELKKADEHFAKIIISENEENTINDINDLGISKTEILLFNLFLKQIDGKIDFLRKDNQNIIILTFRYGN